MNPNTFSKIAVVGASGNPNKYGNKIVKDLKAKGFKVYPVNPNYEEIEELKCFNTTGELPHDVELIVFVVPSNIGLKESEKAINLGFNNLWFQPGAESKEIEEFLKKIDGLNYSIGKCIMMETKEKV